MLLLLLGISDSFADGILGTTNGTTTVGAGAGGSATNLTPWPSDINGSGKSLTNALNIYATGEINQNPYGLNAFNLAIGAQSLSRQSPDVSISSAFGYKALSLFTNGYACDSFGANSLRTLTNGDHVVAFGEQAGEGLTHASQDIAFGIDALSNFGGGDGTASYCIAVGNNSLEFSGGYYNIGVGHSTLHSIGAGQQNIAIGYQSLAPATNSSSQNISIGTTAMSAALSANGNVAVGHSALITLTNGDYNTAVGYIAGSDSFGGNYNSLVDNHDTFIGGQSGRDNTVANTSAITYSTALGYGAKVGASHTIVLGTTNEVVVVPQSLLIPTNYLAANFVPVAGYLKLVSSNGLLYKVTQQSTNLVSTGP